MKTRKRRILSVLLVLAMLLTILPAAALADDTDAANGALILAHALKAQFPVTDMEDYYEYAVMDSELETNSSGTSRNYYHYEIDLDEENHELVFQMLMDFGANDVSDGIVIMFMDYTTNTVSDSLVYLVDDETLGTDQAVAEIDAASYNTNTALQFYGIDENDELYNINYYTNYNYSGIVRRAFIRWARLLNWVGLTWNNLGFTAYDTVSNPTAGPTHIWDSGVVVKPATCLDTGLSSYTCTLDGCGATTTMKTSLGSHSWDNGTLTTPMTDTQEGVVTYTCKVCGETKTARLPAGGSPYLDVQNSTLYFYDPILWAAEQGITKGTSDFTFSPMQSCTRGQIVTFLWRAAGEPEPETDECPFTDVAPGAYYYDAVLWAVEKGITNGTSPTTFSPNAFCTRCQCVTFLWRYEEKPTVTDTENPYTDVQEGAYYTDAVLWAVEKGITNGTSPTTFSPNAKCTRGQIVTFLYRDFQAK